MRESRSYGSVGERGGNEPLYPENPWLSILCLNNPNGVEYKEDAMIQPRWGC